MSRVFIPHNVTKWDVTKNREVPAFNLTDASSFGVLTPILKSVTDTVFVAQMTETISSALSDVTPEDYLLAIGDPTAIAICAGVILRKQPTINMLKWDRRARRYIKIEVKL